MPIIVRHSEIFTKSPHVQREWERVLLNNIARRLECSVEQLRGRIVLHDCSIGDARPVLETTFGVHSFSPAEECRSELKAIEALAVKLAERGKSVDVKVNRPWKGFPMTSFETMMAVRRHVADALGVRPDYVKPQQVIHIEIFEETTFVFRDVLRGPGGLPVGTGPRLLLVNDRPEALLAGWLVMKRGSPVDVYGKALPALDQWSSGLKIGVVEGDLAEVAKAYPSVVSAADDPGKIGHKGFSVLYPLIGLSAPMLADIRAKAGQTFK
jgi:thiamine biosynthesis protein ThiI